MIFGQEIIYLETVDSTNTYLKKIAKNKNEGLVVISKEQTHGKGRVGKSFKSNYDEGIWMSILLKPKINIQKISFITLIAGASVVKSLNELNVEVKIKWPNDIILNNKKLGGILTELSSQDKDNNNLIVGIGINVKTLNFDDEIKNIATSLYKENHKISKNEIISKFLENFEKLYFDYVNKNEKSEVLKICKNFSSVINKDVYIIKNNQKELVKVIDINDDGDLVVLDEFLQTKNIISGEISIRGENGYI